MGYSGRRTGGDSADHDRGRANLRDDRAADGHAADRTRSFVTPNHLTAPGGHFLFAVFFFLIAAPRFFVAVGAGAAGSAAVMSVIAFQLPSACFIQQVT